MMRPLIDMMMMNITIPVPTAVILHSRDNEKLDINATMEHLIITGTCYFLFTQWRNQFNKNESTCSP